MSGCTIATSAPYDADDGEHDEERREVACLFGEEREVEAQQSVSPHLQQNACEYDAPGGRRFRVRVRQPSVEWEERDFDAEREREGEEKPERPLGCEPV